MESSVSYADPVGFDSQPCHNPKRIGEISEAKVIARCLELGYSVSVPFGNNARYDLILDDAVTLERCQVKTARSEQDDAVLVFSVASVNGFTGKRTDYIDQVDCFLVYAPYNGLVYRLPVMGKSAVYLRLKETKVQHPRTRWAADYLF